MRQDGDYKGYLKKKRMILYLNNFKGFNDTFIPLERVNFLVGENSTGKSTVLSVLEMLSKSTFWTSPQLSSGEFHLGPFNEIVNQLSTDKSFFQIGAEFEAQNSFDSKAQRAIFRILETFKERDGSIVLDSIKFLYNNETYFCSQVGERKVSVSRRRVRYPDFTKWIYSETPLRQKEILNAPFFYMWIPGLMKIVCDCFNSESDNYYQLYYPPELNNLTIISPIRAEAHRIYESFSQSYSPQGEHIPVVLNKIMHSNSAENKTIVRRLCEFGKHSNLFDSIATPKFGNSSEAPFSVSVQYNNVKVNLTNVGYGVTQSLPFVVEILKSSEKPFSIQQPEVHLHPKAQAAFGELLYESAINNHNTFFCETHSDFVINRYRYATNKSGKYVKSQVLFFTRDEKGTHVVPIPIDENGHYNNVPDEYMRFFVDEELRMLEF